jgi:hypothetical protein
MRILHISIAALIYGAIYQMYPQFVYPVIEAAIRGNSSPLWGHAAETLLFAGIATACTVVLFRISQPLRQAAGLADGRWLMRAGVVLLLVWRFGAIVMLRVMFAAGYRGSASVGEAGDRLVGNVVQIMGSAPAFWTAMSLMAIGVCRAFLGQMKQPKVEADAQAGQ